MIPEFWTSRAEAYLAKILGQSVELPVPQTRLDRFLAKIAGEAVELPVPQARVELYLAKIAGENVELPIPQTRVDLYLAKKAGIDVDLPAEPQTRLEAYLAEWSGEPSEQWKTVTGSLIHITDALASPVNALSVSIAPVQDLHGYDNPWPAGGGVNLLPHPAQTTKTAGTTTCTTDGNGNYHFTAVSDSGSRTFIFDLPSPFVMPENSYLHYMNNSTNNGVTISFRDNNGTAIGSGMSFSAKNRILKIASNIVGQTVYKIGVYKAAATTDADITFSPMICADDTVRPFAPYSNICPISGWDSVNVWVKPTHDTSADPTASITFPTPPGTVYGGTLDVITGVLTVDKVLLTFSGGATSEGIYGDDNAELYRLEIPNYNTTKIVRAQSTTSVGRLSSNYFKFISTTSAAKMKDAEIRTQAANTPQYLYFRWDSATDVSAINAAFANTALQVIAELQSPQTYQLTPQEVSTLLGENNIWADTGDTTVTYLANA